MPLVEMKDTLDNGGHVTLARLSTFAPDFNFPQKNN